MREVTRAVSILIGAGLAGLLVWTSTQMNASTTGGYWAVQGIVAAAGLVLVLTQLAGRRTTGGRPRLAAVPFLIGFLPALVAAGWVAMAAQPDPGWLQSHVNSWSGDIGLQTVVDDLRAEVSLLAFGLGLVLGLVLTTAEPRPEPSGPPVEAEPEPDAGFRSDEADTRELVSSR